MNTRILRNKNSSVNSGFFLSLILVITPAVLFAQDVSIWDFRIPETKYQRLTGSLSGGWNKTDYSYTDYSFGTLQNHSSNSSKPSNAQSTLGYVFANYSENNSLEITANVMGQANHNSSDGSYSYTTQNYQSSSQVQTNYNVMIWPDIRYSNYLIPDTWHWFAEGSGDYSFNQYTDNSNTAYSDGSHSYDSSFSKNNFWNASVGCGIGYGKLRDGSSIFAVLRILDKLTEDSVLVRPLTKDEVLRIVDVFAKEGEYSYTQDRYIKYFMEDVFGQLQKMGALKENAATAYSVLRAVEVLSERIEPRLFGWRARFGVQRTYTREINVSDQSDYSYTANDNTVTYNTYNYSNYLWYFRDYVSLALDYGYPLTLNFQVNSNLSVEIPRIDYQRKIGYTYQLAGIYQVGERIDATISGSVSRTTNLYQSANENEFFRSVQYTAGVSFRFFIENNVNFSMSCRYSEWHQDHFLLSASGNDVYKSPSISFAVNYRFL
jgi:hypothetical protein